MKSKSKKEWKRQSNSAKEPCFNNCRVIVWKASFAIVKSKSPHPKAFANIIDKKEITVIIKQSMLNEAEAEKTEKDWKILTFDAVLPFGLVGFIARVAKALAEENIPIFVVSAYSTDHLLVKEKHLAKARKKLESLGFDVEEK